MIKNILIVPSEPISDYSTGIGSEFLRQRAFSAFQTLRRGHFVSALKQLKFHPVGKMPYSCAEILHYADVPAILGAENTYILGNYFLDYVADEISPLTRFPSFVKTPPGTHVSFWEACQLVKRVDAVLIGRRSGEVGRSIYQLCQKHQVFVAGLDHFDDPGIYGDLRAERLTERFGVRYDLYFKHDLPLGLGSELVLPINPMPVRPECYPEVFPSYNERAVPVFYRGQKRLEEVRADRLLLAEAVAASIPGSVIDNQNVLKTYTLDELWKQYQSARVGLTPSGKVWDSTRHAEIAMFGCVPLICQPDCETVAGLVKDGQNCVTYRTERQSDGTYAVQKLEAVFERLRAVLNDADEWQRLSAAWRAEILANHTTLARARYLIQSISRLAQK